MIFFFAYYDISQMFDKTIFVVVEVDESTDRRLSTLYLGDCLIKEIKQKDFIFEKGSWMERP